MHYTGPQDAVCPITLTPVDELRWPVALNGNTARPYECEALVDWVLHRPRDPMTNLRMTRIAIRPLEGLVSASESMAAAAYLKRKFMRPCVGWKGSRCSFCCTLVANTTPCCRSVHTIVHCIFDGFSDLLCVHQA
jgi:hypothetical protein